MPRPRITPVVQEQSKFKLINYDDIVGRDEVVDDHPFLKSYFRMAIIGKTRSGKTNLTLNLITNDDMKINNQKLILMAGRLQEKKYEWLINFYKEKEQEYEKKTGKKISLIFYSNKLDDIPELNSLDTKFSHLLLVDDLCNEPVKTIGMKKLMEYFDFGRKCRVNLIFLAPAWYRLFKSFRAQCEYFVLYRVPDSRHLPTIYHELETDITYEDFLKAYTTSTKQLRQFLFIDMIATNAVDKYKKGFDGKHEHLEKYTNNDEYSE